MTFCRLLDTSMAAAMSQHQMAAAPQVFRDTRTASWWQSWIWICVVRYFLAVSQQNLLYILCQTGTCSQAQQANIMLWESGKCWAAPWAAALGSIQLNLCDCMYRYEISGVSRWQPDTRCMQSYCQTTSRLSSVLNWLKSPSEQIVISQNMFSQKHVFAGYLSWPKVQRLLTTFYAINSCHVTHWSCQPADIQVGSVLHDFPKLKDWQHQISVLHIGHLSDPATVYIPI